MKIGIDISQTVYEGTGTAVYFNNLISWLLKIDSRNEYVFFGASFRRRKRGFWPIPPTVLDILWNRLHIFPVENFIGKIDIFHSSDWTQPPTKAKKVAPILDMIVYKFPRLIHPKSVTVQKRRMEWVKKEADKIITISQSAKKDIIDILKIPEEKIKVIYLAPGEEFKPQKEITRNYVLTMGNLSNPRKNAANVIAACKQINAPLKIIDGTVRQDHLPKLYAGAKCFVYPSLYEGFGMPVLEALSCDTPVICGRNSSLPEVGGDAVTYAEVENVDDLAEKIINIRKTGRELAQAKKFSWEKTARETLKVYEEMA